MAKVNYFTELPGWAKGLVAVAVVGSAIGLFYMGKNIIKGFKSKSEREEAKDIKQELANAIKTQTLSYPESSYSSFANSLEQAFQGYMTDWGLVLSVFEKMKRDVDVYKLIDVYGTRTISSGTWNPEPDFKGGLTGAMGSELSGLELAQINVLLNKKGIKFQF